MKKHSYIYGAIVLFVLLIAGCSLFSGATTDVIVGKWQQVSVAGIPAILVNVIQFTDTTYTTSTAGVTVNTGTWTKSGSSYTLTGAIFGFLSSTSTITPTFSSSNNTMTYTDGSGATEVWNRT